MHWSILQTSRLPAALLLAFLVLPAIALKAVWCDASGITIPKEREWIQDLIKIKSCFNASWSVCVSRSMMHGLTRELILYLWGLEQYLLRELNLELILFILALILPALSSLFFSTLLVFILPSSFQLFFSPLPSPSFWFFPFLFSTLFM